MGDSDAVPLAYLRVILETEDLSALALHGHNGALLTGGHDMEALRQLLGFVTMAHPDQLPGRVLDVPEQSASRRTIDISSSAVSLRVCSLDLASEDADDELHPVVRIPGRGFFCLGRVFEEEVGDSGGALDVDGVQAP